MAEYIVQTSVPLGGHFKPGDYEEVYGKVMQEVVCCRDCRYAPAVDRFVGSFHIKHEAGTKCSFWSDSDYGDADVNPNGFCAWGEPKEN